MLDQNYSIIEVAKAMGIGQSTMDKWVRQLKLERKGISPKASPMMSEQVQIRELKKKIAQLEEYNEILKNQVAFKTIKQ